MITTAQIAVVEIDENPEADMTPVRYITSRKGVFAFVDRYNRRFGTH